MKHIFTVHSPITFLCSYGIIKQEEIPEEDVIILSAGYKVPFEIGRVVSAFQNTQSSIWQKLRNWNVPKAYDTYIDSLIKKEDFIAYIDLMHAYQRILVTHAKCRQFHFMEEGTGSYEVGTNILFLTQWVDVFNFRHSDYKSFIKSLIKTLRGYTPRIISLPFYGQSYAYLEGIKFYTLSEDGFPNIDFEKKRIIELSAKDAYIEKMALNQQLNNVTVWVEESFPFVFNVPSENYNKAIRKSLEIISATYPHYKHFIKLRPRQNPESSPMLEVLRSGGYSPEVLDNEIMIEPLLLRSSGCVVVGCISSVLYYAVLFGHRALSMFDILEDKPYSVYDELDSYWKKVERL